MNKLMTVLLSVIVCFAMIVPEAAFASGEADGTVPQQNETILGDDVEEPTEDVTDADQETELDEGSEDEQLDEADPEDGEEPEEELMPEEPEQADQDDALDESDDEIDETDPADEADPAVEEKSEDPEEPEDSEEPEGTVQQEDADDQEEIDVQPGSDELTRDVQEEAAAEGSEEELDEEPEEEEIEPVTEAAEITLDDAYAQIRLLDVYEKGALIMPESMSAVTGSKTKYGNGLLLTGKVGELKSGTIGINTELDFNSNRVGRLTVDGLGDRGVNVNVKVYLDDAEEPVATFRLGSQMGKKAWANAGDHTKDVYGLNLTGTHRVSFGFDITGKKDSKETSILIRSIEFSESSLPVMYFNIDESKGSIAAMNGSSDHSVECYGSVDLQVPEGFVSEYSDTAQESLSGLELEYVRGRGNSTWSNDKKPYKVKFDKKQDLFGMGANKHWVLLANRYDNSLIRNRMTYWLGEQMGLEFTPQCIPVDVVMNDQYYGSYLLCEQIRIAAGRVDIDDLEDNEETMQRTDLPFISGGYLVSMEPYGDEDPDNMFTTNRGAGMFIESPSFEDYNNDTQRQYIKGYIQQTEDAIFGSDFKDANGNSYTEYLDLDAATNYWWIQEFSANGDAYGSGSTFLYKKRNGKLYWGPLWDFDYVAWGDLDYNVDPPEGFDYTNMIWFDRMKSDPAFNAKRKARWTVLNAKLNEITKDGGLLDQYYEQTKISWKYDNEKWGSYGEWWDEESDQISGSRTYKEEVDQLRDWIKGRQDWVNNNIDQLTPAVYTVTFKIDGKVVEKRKVTEGSSLDNLPKAPAKDGYYFTGWESKTYGIITEGSSVYANMTLTPSYVDKSKATWAKDLFFQDYDPYTPFYEWDEENCYYPSYSVMPWDADIQTVKWSSSDKSIATVDGDGTVHCHKIGKVVITGKIGSKVSNSYTLHIFDGESSYGDMIQYIKLNKSKLTLKTDEYTQLRAKYGPKPCDGMPTWISLDTNVAVVDYTGVVTAVGPGTTGILAIDTMSENYAVCNVTVTKPLKTPKLTTLSVYGENTVQASWDKVKGANAYNIAYRKAGAKKWTVKKTTKTSYSIKELKKGSLYEFRVRALSKNDQSKWSTIKRRYFKRVTAKLNGGTKKVTVKWNSDSKATGYQIKYSYKSDMSNAKAITVGKSRSSYTIKNLKKGKVVYVRVRPIRKYSGKTYFGVMSLRKKATVK